jgi:serine/threonine protein phosphatase PrpC
MLEIDFGEVSDCGRVRPGNEDYLGHVAPETPEQARTHGWLFAVADGVGGHEQGELASQTAIETLLAGFRAAGKGEPLTTLLPRLVQLANARVFETGISNSGGAGMATTLVACALRYDRAVVAHVGDSRCYLIRNGEARLLTRDHTVAGEHERLGLLSAEEASEADSRHILSRALGGGLFVSVEVTDHQVLPGDILLLCSDGLHGAISSSDMTQIASNGNSLEVMARGMVSLANEKDGGDNATAQLIRVQNVERVAMYRGRPYKLR